jgi:hypothetical protein
VAVIVSAGLSVSPAEAREPQWETVEYTIHASHETVNGEDYETLEFDFHGPHDLIEAGLAWSKGTSYLGNPWNPEETDYEGFRSITLSTDGPVPGTPLFTKLAGTRWFKFVGTLGGVIDFYDTCRYWDAASGCGATHENYWNTWTAEVRLWPTSYGSWRKVGDRLWEISRPMAGEVMFDTLTYPDGVREFPVTGEIVKTVRRVAD